MRRKTPKRKQRVVLRVRSREKLKQRFGLWLMRSTVMVLAIAFVLGMVVRKDSLVGAFVKRHTPVVEIQVPKTLAGQPIFLEWPQERFWLWIPGVPSWAARRLQKKDPAIRAVRLERNFSTNRVSVRIEPRIPLVRMDATGLDREGVVFPILPDGWKSLPRARFSPALARPVLGAWLSSFAQQGSFWCQVVAVSDNGQGDMIFDLKTGARITWGRLETKGLTERMTALSSVLEDAHLHLGGTALADLRFFEQGRIIIRPKSVK